MSNRYILLLPLISASCVGLADEISSTALPQVRVWGQQEAAPPSEAVPDVGSPQSVVSEQVIHEIVSPIGDYGVVADLTPSFVSSAPNGPGFDAAKNETLRGFVDGQYR